MELLPMILQEIKEMRQELREHNSAVGKLTTKVALQGQRIGLISAGIATAVAGAVAWISNAFGFGK